MVFFVRAVMPLFDELESSRRRSWGREQADFVRSVVRRELLRLPTGGQAGRWGLLQTRLEDVFRELPHLRGIVLRAGEDPLLEVEQGRLDPAVATLEPSPDLALRLLAEGQVFVAFPVEGELDGRGRSVSAHVHLQFPPSPEVRTLADTIRYGVLILGVLIYVLAALAILIGRVQTSVANREREKAVRLKAIRDVAGGIAHEVRNPLNAISLLLQYLERSGRKTGSAPGPEDYGRIHHELRKIRGVVDDFVKFARIQDLAPSECDLGEIVGEVFEAQRTAMAEEEVEGRLDLQGSLEGRWDREKLRVALTALVQHAIEVSKGTEEARVEIRASGERQNVMISIRDSSEVVDEAETRNLFEPDWSSKSSSVGFGMTVARTLILTHHGAIGAEPATGGGCVVNVTLPRGLR